MQKDSYRNGMKVGKAAKAMITFLTNIKYQMLAKAGQSKWKRSLANILFIGVILVFIGLMASVLYYAIGVVGPVIILLIAIALPKVYSSSGGDDENTYSFNDGYRDGPEGYGYYSGGFKVDD
ncbi:hypothetical protein [Pantoea endophytica]|uniref:hypothetical protein n=1 Tax=Pantoea endophytica TaxID=92488 RepID=UPI003015DC68